MTGLGTRPPRSGSGDGALSAVFLPPFGAELPEVSGQMLLRSAGMCREMMSRQAVAGRKGKGGGKK